MKKFVVLLTVVALTCFSAMAFAADVTVGGSYEIRSRNFNNLNMNETIATGDTERDTQNRIRIDVNAKAGDVKGKLQLQNDFAKTWGDVTVGGFETTGGSSIGGTGLHFREAWVNFNIPGLPVNVTGGHQLLTLGNGWFFRSMHYGSDAWVIANQTGNNTLAFVNVKLEENETRRSDDRDAYSILDVFKLNDAMTVGGDITMLTENSATSKLNLQNIGLNFNGKVGPVALKAEIDVQMGDIDNLAAGANDPKFKGNQIVLQGNMKFDPVGVNVTIARGTGMKAGSNDIDGFQTALDVDPHYTFLYEYKLATAAGAKNTGFSNTTAVGVGVTAAATKSVTVGVDAWLLQATEKTNVALTGTPGAASDDIGTEVDVKINWKLYDNLAWNWTIGYFMPGDAYKNTAGKGDDEVTGIQGVLAFKF